MCGISVVVALNGGKLEAAPSAGDAVSTGHSSHYVKHDEASQQLNDSLDIIAHRGPDSRGRWISPDRRVALGHVRLAINDLSPEGAQPFSDPDDTIHAVVNGELYDHERIRTNLIKATGYKFKGHSDCEIVIALYKHYGLSFLSQLRGEFALCLYDSHSHIFIAARDRYGIKPLFYTFDQGRLLVAAEVKAFLPLGWKPEWDVKALVDGGWGQDERTIFRGVRKVRPGHYLVCDAFENVEGGQYWDVEFPDKRTVETRSEDEMVIGVRERMLESIRLRLKADVPVGVYLSGGIDSSVIAGMVTYLMREKGEKAGSGSGPNVSCFSIVFDEKEYDESAIAKRTAEFLGVEWYQKHMNEQAIAERFEDATWHCEHHNHDLNYVGKFALSEEPNKVGFKVVLTGEGADENFGGYDMYLADYLREPDLAQPQSGFSDQDRKIACVEADRRTSDFYKSIGADGDNRGDCVALRELNGISTCSSMAAFSFTAWAGWTKHYAEIDPRLTIAHNVNGRVRDAMTERWHPLHSAQYIWTKGHLANNFLSCLGDRTEMAHSLEARTPFLDHYLTSYVNHLPPSVKIRRDDSQPTGFVHKWILREAAKPFITHELYTRKKHAYSAPTTWPVDGPLHKVMAKLVTRDNVMSLGFVDWQKVEGLVERAFEGKDAKAMRGTIILAQWITIAKRFGVKVAGPEEWMNN